MRPETVIRRHTSTAPWTYAMADAFQRDVRDRLVREPASAPVLLLSEFAPVVTYGRRTPPPHLQLSAAQFAERGVALQPVDRGGLATYHGPGQWVLFFIDRLERLTGDSRGVRKAVDRLLQIASEAAARYRAQRRFGSGPELGVWSDRGKFAAVGIQISQGVVLHGVAVNGYRTAESFAGIAPCGLDRPIDFLLDSADESAFLRLGERLVKAALAPAFNG